MKRKKSNIKSQHTSRIQDSSFVGAQHSMKPLGKYLGMDTFSWHNPDLNLLNKTIQNFPFDILWLGNENEVESFLDFNPRVGSKIKSIVLYGADMKDNCSDKIISVSSIVNALEFVDTLIFKPGILLLTASDADSEFSLKSFESHVLKSQIRK
ncbi:MAG: hypothetical protein P8H94_06705 [Crocinitomicaceae bacterium]|nr:hypothetical protein [Crocinitomicaceae bacterium]